MTLLELIESLDARGIAIEVAPKLTGARASSLPAGDIDTVKLYRLELMQVALARAYMAIALDLEKQWAGYPARRTDELEIQIARAKATALYLLPDGLPWSVVAGIRPDGTEVAVPDYAGVA